VSLGPLASGTGVPVTPGAEEAQRWARDELADEIYRQAEPGLLARAIGWLLDRLASIELPTADGSRLWLVAALLVLAAGVVVALALAGPVRGRGRRGRARAVLDDETTDAAGHRAAADAHAAAGRWREAVRERFRAVVRALEERALLVPTPGRTADEAAAEAGALLPDVAADLRAGARLFDDVWYGGRPATAAHDQRLRDLDAAVAASRPRLDVAPALPGAVR
jgi:hypothetical protein